MRKYEVIFIVKPLDEEAINGVCYKFENVITTNDDNIDKMISWVKRLMK